MRIGVFQRVRILEEHILVGIREEYQFPLQEGYAQVVAREFDKRGAHHYGHRIREGGRKGP